jgi:Stage II sporulation protein E (SpoIIE)
MTKGQYTDAYFLARRRHPMGLAAEMQWQLLPPLTFVTPRVVIAGLLEPAYEVAGDAFDYALNGDTAHLAIIDPVGHDPTASILAAVTLGSYRHSRRVGLGLNDTHAAMDQLIATQFGGETFVTGQLAQLDCATGRLQWLNTGHPRPLLVRRAKVVDTLACNPAPPLGLGVGSTRSPLRPSNRMTGCCSTRRGRRGPQPGRRAVQGGPPGRPAGTRDPGRPARRRDDAPTRPCDPGPPRRQAT